MVRVPVNRTNRRKVERLIMQPIHDACTSGRFLRQLWPGAWYRSQQFRDTLPAHRLNAVKLPVLQCVRGDKGMQVWLCENYVQYIHLGRRPGDRDSRSR